MRRALVMIATGLVLWTVTAELNHGLTSAHVYLFVGGLYLAFNALNFPLRSGMLASFVMGLLCDAAEPVPFGTHAFLFATAHAVIFNLKRRIPRDDTIATVLVALFANLGIFLSLCFVETVRSSASAPAWARILMDLFVSQICLALMAPWFIALQKHSLKLLGLGVDRLY